ncbi:metal-dependent hydrolase [Aliivibrio sp. SR45-2]|uniref:metal-dependent hydrolase n=1 Tax=Aliivibrio sp. SR45-2 TaxID=2760931 RepID=UPI0015FB0315|nr:metal-dependent hydrolase [Aliivibrio sp. SR45-2]MBB1313824.1 metal-dependent hydrolase [Aliivibrio sp. SR45-2]
MANFSTHLNVAALASGVASAALLSANHIELNTALWLWFLGTLGGLLPDIDSDNSTSLDIIFNLFTVCIVLLSIRYFTSDAINERQFMLLIGLPVVIHLVIKYGIRNVFEWQTIHRGICHSILFLLFCGLLATNLTAFIINEQFKHADLFSWLSGAFVFCGGIIHLLLDELYSVDLANVRIKRSFGSACKLTDFSNLSLTTVFLVAVAILALLAPPIESTIITLSNWQSFKIW